MTNPAYALVLWGFYPLWLLAAGLDYLCHRCTRIEQTAGLEENHLHLWQFASMVALVLGAALFSATGVMLLILVSLAVMHTLLAYIDVWYTQPRRRISAFEQHAHGCLVVLPIAALALIAVFDAHLATHTAWLSWRRPALSGPALALLAASLLLGGAPLVEEWWRCYRQR